MKNIIVGTAGHIDHGKTTLVKALTGRNTDRWEEEKRRGITIDLGFTYFDLKNGDRVGIIDVPGHEKFVNNMVAGVVGMDLVLLVIAADEGIMPQTREHMDILGLLGMKNSIVVLNKCDLVDSEWLELVKEELREELEGTFLDKAPIIEVSATTGTGIPLLISTIEHLTAEVVEEKDTATIPRLPIDRVFTLSGFGTVITGTLLSGTIRKEDTLELYPNGTLCKIRSIQVHGENQERCVAGQRVAINISNVKKSEVQRGCVLAPANNMQNTRLLDAKLQMLPSAQRMLKNNTRLHLFTGTSEILCRVVLLDKDELRNGEMGFVQLRLEKECALRRGDKFIVRFYSPLETIGGGIILESNPQKKKRFQPDILEELKKKESGTTEDVIELHIKRQKEQMITLGELAKQAALSMEEVEVDINALEKTGLIKVFSLKKEVYVWHVESEQGIRKQILKTLEEYQKQHPYQHGMKKAEIQSMFLKKVKRNVFDLYIDEVVEANIVGRYLEYLHSPEFVIEKGSEYRNIVGTMIDSFEKASYDFLKFSESSFGKMAKEDVVDILSLQIEEGIVIKVSDDLYTTKSLMDSAQKVVEQVLKESNRITIGEVRDLLQTSRKSAKPILEYMDSIKVTRKNGPETERVAYL